MIPIQVDPAWSASFPGAHIGLLEARRLPPMATHPALDRRRIELEEELRKAHGGLDRGGLRELPVMRAFEAHFRPRGKTYHVLAQLESVVHKGRSVPSRVCAVTAMFMAELKHGLVTAGHDLDLLAPPLRFAPSQGGERFVNLGGAEVTIPAGDMTCSHARGLLSSVLQGPDRDTPIGADTRNVLCTIYAPRGVPEGALEAQLADLAGYFKLFAPDGQLETLILPSPMADRPAGGGDLRRL